MKQKAVLYCRYSSHSQKDVSIDQQIKECRAYADRQGIEIIKVYPDRAITGTNDQRPMFQQMIAEAEAMQYQYVIVYSLDRFARDRYDSAVYKRQLKQTGKRVLSVTETISDDASGVLMEALLEGMAEYYSKELSRKIHRGMDDNAAKCLVNGPIPYGYRRGSDGRYKIEDIEAQIVREIFSRARAGEHLIDIARSLNDRGFRTKSGAEWNKNSFNRMLSNERYAGVYLYKEIRVEGGVPAIVDRETFDAVQHILHTKPNPRGTADLPTRRHRENGVYLLTGKAFCGNCGSPMIGVSGKRVGPKTHYYYLCKKRRSADGCDTHSWRRDELEKEVVAAINEYVLTDEMIPMIADLAIQQQAKRMDDGAVPALIGRLDEVEKAIKNILTAIESGMFTTSMKDRMTELEDERQMLQNEIAYEQSKREPDVSRDDLIALMYLFKDGDISDKDYQERLIDAFLVAVYVYDDHLHIDFRIGTAADGKSVDVEILDDAEKRIADGEEVRLRETQLHQKEKTPKRVSFLLVLERESRIINPNELIYEYQTHGGGDCSLPLFSICN